MKNFHVILPTGKNYILQPEEVEAIKRASHCESRSITRSVSAILKTEAHKILTLENKIREEKTYAKK